MQAYVDFLVTHRFNAVRLPLSATLVNSNTAASSSQCGDYSGQATLAVLDDVLTRLRDAGIFAVLDIHTLSHPESNEGLWCGGGTSCTASSEEPLVSAWTRLAQRYCTSHPNVIGADLCAPCHAAPKSPDARRPPQSYTPAPALATTSTTLTHPHPLEGSTSRSQRPGVLARTARAGTSRLPGSATPSTPSAAAG